MDKFLAVIKYGSHRDDLDVVPTVIEAENLDEAKLIFDKMRVSYDSLGEINSSSPRVNIIRLRRNMKTVAKENFD